MVEAVRAATTTDPPLSTIRQPLEEMGRLAAGLATALASGDDVTHSHTLPVRLVVRESL